MKHLFFNYNKGDTLSFDNDTIHIIITRFLGKGWCGSVFAIKYYEGDKDDKDDKDEKKYRDCVMKIFTKKCPPHKFLREVYIPFTMKENNSIEGLSPYINHFVENDKMVVIFEAIKNNNNYYSSDLTRTLKYVKYSLNDIILLSYRISHILKNLHDNGIAHRDIKPDNIVIQNKLYPYIIDYNSACFFCTDTLQDYDNYVIHDVSYNISEEIECPRHGVIGDKLYRDPYAYLLSINQNPELLLNCKSVCSDRNEPYDNNELHIENTIENKGGCEVYCEELKDGKGRCNVCEEMDDYLCRKSECTNWIMSDIYSLGTVFYFLLYNKLPFTDIPSHKDYAILEIENYDSIPFDMIDKYNGVDEMDCEMEEKCDPNIVKYYYEILIKSMLNPNPCLRPRNGEVINFLHLLLDYINE